VVSFFRDLEPLSKTGIGAKIKAEKPATKTPSQKSERNAASLGCEIDLTSVSSRSLQIDIMSDSKLCPGFFSRETQKLLDLVPKLTTKICEICGESVEAIHKDGRWIPRNHEPRSKRSSKRERVRWVNHV
jgi:hypothetical protein